MTQEAIRKKVEALLGQMTLEEKAAQMIQVPYTVVGREESLRWARLGAGSFLHVLGDDAREVRRAPRCRDNYAKTARARARRIFQNLVRRTMRAHHMNFITDVKFVERVRNAVNFRPVAVASHNNSNANCLFRHNKSLRNSSQAEKNARR